MKPDDIPDDVRLIAAQVVVMLPPMPSIHETGEAINRIARAILAERARCATFALHGVRDGKSIVDFRPEAIHCAIMDGRDAIKERAK